MTHKWPPNQKLRRERELRGWSQADVATRIGSDPKNVGRWERGEGLPGPYYRQKLVELFGKNAEELGLIEDAPTRNLLTSSQTEQVIGAIDAGEDRRVRRARGGSIHDRDWGPTVGEDRWRDD